MEVFLAAEAAEAAEGAGRFDILKDINSKDAKVV